MWDSFTIPRTCSTAQTRTIKQHREGENSTHMKSSLTTENELESILVFANKFASQQRVDLDQMQGRLESVISLHPCGSSLTKLKQKEMAILYTK